MGKKLACVKQESLTQRVHKALGGGERGWGKVKWEVGWKFKDKDHSWVTVLKPNVGLSATER